jgi:hypothetical protein
MTLKQAKDKVLEVLQDRFPETEVSVYYWQDGDIEDTYAIRVAEVGFVQRNATGITGGCYMQSDLPHGLAVCAQVERYIISLTKNFEPEEILEERERLLWLLK